MIRATSKQFSSIWLFYFLLVCLMKPFHFPEIYLVRFSRTQKVTVSKTRIFWTETRPRREVRERGEKERETGGHAGRETDIQSLGKVRFIFVSYRQVGISTLIDTSSKFQFDHFVQRQLFKSRSLLAKICYISFLTSSSISHEKRERDEISLMVIKKSFKKYILSIINADAYLDVDLKILFFCKKNIR